MTKDRLRRYRDLLAEKVQLEQQLETIEGVLHNPKIQQLKQTPRASSKGNPTEDLIAKHLELVDLYQDKLTGLAVEQLAIEEEKELISLIENNALSNSGLINPMTSLNPPIMSLTLFSFKCDAISVNPNTYVLADKYIIKGLNKP